MEANKIDAALAERFSEQPNEYVPSAEALPVNMPAGNLKQSVKLTQISTVWP